VVVMVAATLGAAACGGSSGGNPSASTFGADSPWLGAFATVDLPVPVNSLTDVACATALRCWATGSTVGGAGAPNGAAVIATVNGGATWSNQVIPAQVGYLSRVACSDQRHCAAVGQTTQTTTGQGVIIETVDGGATWTLEPVPAGVLDVTAITCEPDRSCVAIGTTAGGATALTSNASLSGWTQSGALPPGVSGATAISCTSATDCWVTGSTTVNADAVAGVVVVTTDGGAAWATVATPKGLGYLNGVSCLAGATSGTGALPTTTVTSPVTTAPARDAAVATAPTTAPTAAAPTAPPTTATPAPPTVGVAGARCTVVGTTATSVNSTRSGHAVLLTSDNGGAAWDAPTVTPTSASLADVSCTAIGTCVAVGSTVASSATAGVIILTGGVGDPWDGPAVVSSPQSLSAVSCISLSACVVVGESISEHLAGG
jgi:hypothetical protein